jgi:porphobilinogen deaminase
MKMKKVMDGGCQSPAGELAETKSVAVLHVEVNAYAEDGYL